MHDVHDVQNLSGLDLNLLVVLDALLRERHVTRAAARVGLSQSATSHALARLRKTFDDPLLVRDGSTLVPTARAESLTEPLSRALAALSRALEPPAAFDPHTSKRTFTLAAADYGQFVVLPTLWPRLAAEAPNVDLVIRDQGATSATSALASGEVDVVLAPPSRGVRNATSRAGATSGSGLRHKRLFSERFVCVVRAGHPITRLDLDTYVALPHAFIAPRGTPGGIVDDVLGERGLTRRVALQIQHFLVAPWIIASSDLVITLAERLANAFAERLPLRILEPPLTIPRFAIHMTWHERNHKDPAHRWFRSVVADAARAL